jgi:hypothetical protein
MLNSSHRMAPNVPSLNKLLLPWLLQQLQVQLQDRDIQKVAGLE